MYALFVIVPILALIAGAFLAFRVMRMPEVSSTGDGLPLQPDEVAVRAALVRDVHALANLGQRNARSLRSLAAAADFVHASMQQAGYDVREQWFRVGEIDYRNVFAIVPGTTRPGDVVVIGAHYDTVFDSPGADDNASGVAGMLAVMRALRAHPPQRTVHFVAFANEEPPFFRSSDMGSHHYARSLHERGERVVAMVSVESIGFYRDVPASQFYPAPLARFYPSTANFIAVVSNLRSRDVARQCAEAFRSAGVAVEAAAMPALVPEAAWSDQWSFWQFGYPAVMITDTALFRNPNYHTPEDLPDTLDYDRMTRVVSGLVEVGRVLSSES